MAYIPCCAHNIQLVVKDGLKLSVKYNDLIDRVSKDIVSKSKMSHVIAEELRNLNKKLNTKNLTRWNSILFMVRSVLKMTQEEMRQIRSKMPNKTSDQQKARNNFNLSDIEREMLTELKLLLEEFEWVTDELQSNQINISRVYPCVVTLKQKLSDNTKTYEHTADIRKALLESLIKRFYNLIEEDLFIISTFLDPHFGADQFDDEKIKTVKSRLISLVKQQNTIELVKESVNFLDKTNTEAPKINKNEKKRSQNYVSYRTCTSNLALNSNRIIEDEINDYIRMVSDENFEFTDTLSFWKLNEVRFKDLSKLAKKYLGVQASSAAVERMFSIAGHIFQAKRRKMGVDLFSIIVFLKLNEKLFL